MDCARRGAGNGRRRRGADPFRTAEQRAAGTAGRWATPWPGTATSAPPGACDRRAGRLTVEVTDGGGPTRPLPATPSVTAHGGRGLGIITALADDWGVRDDAPGEVTVWVVVARRARRAPTAGTGATALSLTRASAAAAVRDAATGLRGRVRRPRDRRGTTGSAGPASARGHRGPTGTARRRGASSTGSRRSRRTSARLAPDETSRNRERPTMAKKRPQTKASSPQLSGRGDPGRRRARALPVRLRPPLQGLPRPRRRARGDRAGAAPLRGPARRVRLGGAARAGARRHRRADAEGAACPRASRR